MDLISTQLGQLLMFLLPGFIAAWVFHGLTPYPKPPQFERLVHAFILTAIVNALVWLGNRWWTLPQDQTSVLASGVGAGLLLGVLLAAAANHDLLHAALRRLRITRQNSLPSEWYSAFARHNSYIVLHLSGERRLYGWPEEWPSSPEKGHFHMAEAEWLLTDGTSTPLTGVETVVVPVAQVEMLEFMHPVIRHKETATNEQAAHPPAGQVNQAG